MVDEDGPRPQKVVDKEVYPSTALRVSLSQKHKESDLAVSRIEGTKDAFFVDGLLLPEECSALVAATESIGFTFWDHSSEAKANFRSAHTVEVKHSELADALWVRLEKLFSEKISFEDEEGPRWELLLKDGKWQAYGVNPHLLFGRYHGGGHFGPHSDGCTVVDANRRGLFTALIYLKDTFDGGETLMLKDEQRNIPIAVDSKGRYTATASEEMIIAKVPPRAGRALFFYHTEMHEGAPVGPDDWKYFIRTDILYRRTPEILTTDEDQQAFQMWTEAELLSEKGECDSARILFEKCVRLSQPLAELFRM